MENNRVVIYSNGIADFQRFYELKSNEQKSISIPVQTHHLADVLSSFNVYGNVELSDPPTFQPSNGNEGSVTLNPDNVLLGLATELSGAEIELDLIGSKLTGKLLGIHTEEEATAGDKIATKYLVVASDDGLKKCTLKEIVSWRFLNDEINSEIEKSILLNYQKIKPGSTFVELSLKSGESAENAIVQYTVPAASWKISYRIRLNEDNSSEIQGYAIVDNNTEEDWIDYIISVVTGEPITFSTDLADSKTPNRRHVNLVSEYAIGNVEVEEGYFIGGAGGVAMAGEPETEMVAARRSAKARKSQSGLSGQGALMRQMLDGMPSATTDEADHTEIGDFNFFSSLTPITLPAKRSAAIPVFTLEFDELKHVLHYRFQDHKKRPFRAVDFTNNTDFSLGRGVCTVYEMGEYSGSCVLPALKPKEKRLLPHALETGVSVLKDEKRTRKKLASIDISKGVCLKNTTLKKITQYSLKNSRDREFEIFFDHQTYLEESNIQVTLTYNHDELEITNSEKLEHGQRFIFNLPVNSQLLLEVIETSIEETSIELVSLSEKPENANISWIQKNLIKSNGPFAEEEVIHNCLRMNQDHENLKERISDLVKQVDRLAERQVRLRENIKSGGQDELTNKWRIDLGEAESLIRDIEENQLPNLREEERSKKMEVNQTIYDMSLSWKL